METLIIGLILISTVITTIVNFAKPAYEQFVWKRAVTINIGLSFILGICSAFAIFPMLDIELSAWATILMWLGLGTGSTVFYDLRKLVQNLGSTKKSTEVITSNNDMDSLSDNIKDHDWSNTNNG